MDKLERETFDEAARQGVLDRLSQTVQSFCVPLWWGSQPEPDPRQRHGVRHSHASSCLRSDGQSRP